MRHYARPRPSKLVYLLEDPEAADRNRHWNCIHYTDCLDWVIEQGWTSWSCTKCPYDKDRFMLPLITNSARKTFQTCKRLYRYKYVDCIRPGSTTALRLGTLAHIGFEQFWRGAGKLSALTEMDAAKREDDWWETEAGQIEGARATALILGYYQRWESNRKHWELVSAEETIVEDANNYRIGCKLDVLARRIRTGQLWQIEHKTTSEDISNTGEDYWLRLAMDSQITIYKRMAERRYKEPCSILYDVAKKIQGKPKLKTRIARRKDESDESLEQRKNDARETIDEFQKRLIQEAAHNPDLYVRREVIRTDEQNLQILIEWDEVAREIAHYKGHYPRNDSACNSRFGKCAYLGVCTGVEGLDDPKFSPLDSPHPELDLEEKNAGR